MMDDAANPEVERIVEEMAPARTHEEVTRRMIRRVVVAGMVPLLKRITDLEAQVEALRRGGA